MKKYTITEKEYAEMVEAMNTLTGENQKLRGFIDGMREQLIIGGVVSSLPNKVLMDSQLSDMISGYKMICKPEANFEKYYSKGFTECFEWLKRLTK